MVNATKNLKGGSLAALWGAACLALGSMAYAPQAAAQGVYSKNGVPMDGASTCPDGWDRGSSNKNSMQKTNYCYPRYANSGKIYRNTNGCASGYGENGRNWCLEGYSDPQLNRPGVITKKNMQDRCPAGFHTYHDKCTSNYPKLAKVRHKGNGECKAGEIAEWGIWCVSDYQHLTKHNLTSAATRDWNYIYSFTGGKSPKQNPNSKDRYSEVYIALFGQPEPEKPEQPMGLPQLAGGAAPEAGAEAPAQAPGQGCDEQKAALGSALGGLFGNVGSAAAEVTKKAMGC